MGGARRVYHAMRHVRVTSRGRSREHRVLPVTCPVTRSPFSIPPSLLSLALSAGRQRLSFLHRDYSFRTCACLFRASRLCSKCTLPPFPCSPPSTTTHTVPPSPSPSPPVGSFKVALYDYLSTLALPFCALYDYLLTFRALIAGFCERSWRVFICSST